jgi:hypothetical protein
VCLVSVRLRESVRQSICETFHACITASYNILRHSDLVSTLHSVSPCGACKDVPAPFSGRVSRTAPSNPPGRALEPPVPPTQTLTYTSLCLREDRINSLYSYSQRDLPYTSLWFPSFPQPLPSPPSELCPTKRLRRWIRRYLLGRVSRWFGSVR